MSVSSAVNASAASLEGVPSQDVGRRLLEFAVDGAGVPGVEEAGVALGREGGEVAREGAGGRVRRHGESNRTRTSARKPAVAAAAFRALARICGYHRRRISDAILSARDARADSACAAQVGQVPEPRNWRVRVYSSSMASGAWRRTAALL